MPGELAAKLRLVRCPKCRLLLPEFPHYDVYKCGGCGTTLQAKRRKGETVNSESSSQESKAAPRNSLDLVSEDNECSKTEQLVFPQEIVERTKATISSSGECSLDENGIRGQNENGPRESDLGTKATSSSSGECSSVENGGRDRNDLGKCNGEQLGTSNLSGEDLENKMDTDRCSGIKINPHEVSNKGCSTEPTQCEIEANDTNLQLAGSEESINGRLLLQGAAEELNSALDGEDAKNDKSALAGAKPEVDITGGDSTSKSLSAENYASEKGSISRITPFVNKEGTTSDDHVLSLTEQLKHAQNGINLSFERVRSMDKSDAGEVINLSSELSDTLGELSNSPTTRSSQAYDGSISSYDGMDEQIPYYQHLNPLDNTGSIVDAVSDGRPRRAKGLVHSMIYGDFKAHQHSMKFSSDFPGGKHPVMKVAEREEFPFKMPFHCSGSQSGYESGSPSNQLLDELYCSSTFLPSDSCEDPDQEKMKLLKTIYELQDQLNRTSFMNGETNGRLSTSTSYKGKHISSYHSHDLKEERFHHDLHCPRCNGGCGHGINWCQRHKLSLKPYLAEATSNAHHVDLPCFYCYPQEWQCPAELPPQVICQHEGLCRCHPGHNRYSSHDSYHLNPQWLLGPSKPPLYVCETKSDDQRHLAAHEVKKYLREKQNLANRHVRPVAGGAPFVTCHHCFKLLQLPVDFLLFKRICHKLKCGSCSEVLKFSLMNRSHIVSYVPSELNDRGKVVNGSNRPSESHTNHCHSSQADPVSYSDDFGLSVSRSYSSEGDPVSLAEFHPLHGSECDLSVSHGISEPVTEKKKIASRHSSSSETPAETYESAELVSNTFVSEKVSSQIEARPPSPPRSSPLHQLMGYTSPTQVIRGIHSADEYNLSVNRKNYVGHEKEL